MPKGYYQILWNVGVSLELVQNLVILEKRVGTHDYGILREKEIKDGSKDNGQYVYLKTVDCSSKYIKGLASNMLIFDQTSSVSLIWLKVNKRMLLKSTNGICRQFMVNRIELCDC